MTEDQINRMVREELQRLRRVIREQRAELSVAYEELVECRRPSIDEESERLSTR